MSENDEINVVENPDSQPIRTSDSIKPAANITIVNDTGTNKTKLSNIILFVLLIGTAGYLVYDKFLASQFGVVDGPQVPQQIQIDITKYRNYNACYLENIKKCECAIQVENACSGVTPNAPIGGRR